MAVDAARAAIVSLNSSANRLSAVGVTMPGRLRLRDGVCVSCGDFPAWREVPISQTFVSALEMPVSLIGTTEAAALAESRFGAAQGLSSLLFVTVGIELDIAVIADGKPLMLGEAVPGQAGHMVVAPGGPRCSCGELGCWQAVAGRDALVARVVRDIGSGIPSAISAAVENRLSAVTPAVVCQMAAVGDSVAKNALEETGRFLALGIGNLITLFDPEAVILESAPAPVALELRRATEMAMKTSQRSHIFSRCVMLSPVLGDAARVLGAAAWAGQNVAQHSHATTQ
jgi:glucokinase